MSDRLTVLTDALNDGCLTADEREELLELLDDPTEQDRHYELMRFEVLMRNSFEVRRDTIDEVMVRIASSETRRIELGVMGRVRAIPPASSARLSAVSRRARGRQARRRNRQATRSLIVPLAVAASLIIGLGLALMVALTDDVEQPAPDETPVVERSPRDERPVQPRQETKPERVVEQTPERVEPPPRRSQPPHAHAPAAIVAVRAADGRFLLDGRPWNPRRGTEVPLGARLTQTSWSGYLRFAYPDGTEVAILGPSHWTVLGDVGPGIIDLDLFGDRSSHGPRHPSTERAFERKVVVLEDGYLTADVAPQAQAMRLVTDVGEAVVRGTQLQLDARRGAVRLMVSEGLVDLRPTGAGASEAVPAGRFAEMHHGRIVARGTFDIHGAPVIVGLQVLDAATGRVLQTLDPGEKLVRPADASEGINVLVLTAPPLQAAVLVDAPHRERIDDWEEVPPFTIAGDSDPDGEHAARVLHPWKVSPGSYQVRLTPAAGRERGPYGDPVVFDLEVVEREP